MRKYLKKLLIFGEISIIITIIYIMATMHLQSSYLDKESSQENVTTASEAPVSTQLSSINSSKISLAEEEISQAKNAGKILEERRARVLEQCTQLYIGSKRIPAPAAVLRRLYADVKHHLVWCPTYKAASSTFLRIFAALGNVLTPQAEKQLAEGKIQINNLARKAFPTLKPNKMKELLLSSNRLLIVRHPFERLLSAYRDKLEHKEKREFYNKKYGQKIVQLYGNLTVSEVPTFHQFLLYVAHGHPSDEHWRPYYQECAPCKFDYNFILKTECLQEEQVYLAYATSIMEFLPNGSVHKNPMGHTDRLVAQNYYSTIPRKLLKQVYMIYEYDFQLFDYSAAEYFEMTNTYL